MSGLRSLDSGSMCYFKLYIHAFGGLNSDKIILIVQSSWTKFS